MSVVAAVPAKEWLSMFRIFRRVDGVKIPDGRPLFGYHVSNEEYAELAQVLRESAGDFSRPARKSYWAACFCLYVAESFRRDYDASEGGWSWNGFERALGISLTPAQRSEAVDEGLVKYWGRPIRMQTHRRDNLGSLFAEGGLPWKLVQHDHHGFGRAVRAGLKNYYDNRDAGRSTAEFLDDYLPYLPQSFRNAETRQLLAGIVEQLVTLVENHPITGQEDPASYLDKHVEAWRQGFPIPLGEENGKRLVNDWLRRADRSRGERQQKVEEHAINRCNHWLHLDRYHEQAVTTEVTLPKEIRFIVDPTMLRSTRLELGFYEGDSLLVKAGAVYGQLGGEVDTGVEMSVLLPRQYFRLSRRKPDEPLKVAFLASGQEVYVDTLTDSAISFSGNPLIFEQGDHGWVLTGDSSRRYVTERALLWAPSGAEVEGDGVDCQHKDSDGSWAVITGDVLLRFGEELYRFTPGISEPYGPQVQLKGRVMIDRSLPVTVYRGWPQLLTDTAVAAGREYSRFINSKRNLSEAPLQRYGAFRYKVANNEGETLLLRRFGVLPEDLKISLLPASNREPALVRVTSVAELKARVSGEGIEPKDGELVDGELSLHLKYRGPRPPAGFRLLLSGSGEEPVELRFDYPLDGVRFLTPEGEETKPTELLVDDLLGSQLVLTNGMPGRQLFNIQMHLMGGTDANIKRHYSVLVADRPVSLSLFAFSDDVRQMLSVTGNQDSYIRFSIDSHKPLMRFDIRRFNCILEKENLYTFRLQGARATRVGEPRKVEAMLLSDPAMKPRELEEVTTYGVGMGAFEFQAKMTEGGPWLIYPKPGAADQFRPVLVPNGLIEADAHEIHSLHAATRAYHPKNNPTVIDAQISRMAADLSHSGWSYLEELWDHFKHLPLSTFEAWKALARNPHALALATMRLGFDEAKALRFQEELSIVWEYIPLTTWRDSYSGYADWMNNNGVPQLLIGNIMTQRSQILQSLVSGYKEMAPYIHGGDCSELKQISPGGLLTYLFQELRRNYPEIESWPSYLGTELRKWILSQQVPAQLYDYSNTHETNALAYLPVFLGYVTAGRAKPEDLDVTPDFLKFAIRVLADFDRQGWFIPAHALVTTYLMKEQ